MIKVIEFNLVDDIDFWKNDTLYWSDADSSIDNSSKYVSLADYQDAQTTIQNLQNQMSIDGHTEDCAALQAASVDCSCGFRDISTQENAKVLKLETLLKRWNEIAPELFDLIEEGDIGDPSTSPELNQLIQDTSGAIINDL